MRNWKSLRRWQVAAGILLVFVLLLILIGFPCAENIIKHRVRVEINSVTIEEIGLTQMGMMVDTHITNRNWIGFSVDRVEFDVYFDEVGERVHLGHGDLDDLDLGAGKTSNPEVPLTIENWQLVRRVLIGRIWSTSDIIVEGTAWIDFGPFNVEKEFKEIPVNSLTSG